MDFPNSPAPSGLARPVDALEASGQLRGPPPPPGRQPLPGPLPHTRTRCLLCPPRGKDGVKAERAQRLLVWKVSEKPKEKEGQRPSGAQEGQETMHAEGGTQEAPRKELGLEIQRAWRARWVSRSQPESHVVLSLATGSLRTWARKWIPSADTSLYTCCAGRRLGVGCREDPPRPPRDVPAPGQSRGQAGARGVLRPELSSPEKAAPPAQVSFLLDCSSKFSESNTHSSLAFKMKLN